MAKRSINFKSGLSNAEVQIVPISNTQLKSDQSYSSPYSLGSVENMETPSIFDVYLTPPMDVDSVGIRCMAIHVFQLKAEVYTFDAEGNALGSLFGGQVWHSPDEFADSGIGIPSVEPKDGVSRLRFIVRPGVLGNRSKARWWWDDIVFVGEEVDIGSPGHGEDCDGNCNNITHIHSTIAYSANPINLRDGNKVLSERDLSVQSPGEALSFIRSYSQNKQDDPDFQFMGLGWLHNHFMKVNVTGSSPNREAVVWLPRGGSVKLVEESADHFAATAGSTALLDYDSSADAYTLVAEDKSYYILDGTTGLIKSRHFVSGEAWTYTYNGSDLTEVADDYGRALQFS